MIHGTLVIGYGNSLRTDDGVGRHVAEQLADDARLAGATVVGVHQLTPELALDISRAHLLVLVDAGRGPSPGTFTIERVVRADGARQAWSHHLDPASLLTLADELYGVSPAAYVVTVGVESVEVGDRLSRNVEAVVPLIIDAIAGLVLSQSPGSPAPGVSHA